MDKELVKQLFKEMIFVEGGTFMMGGNGFDSEKPIHKVNLSSFQMAKYPVTQKIWEAVMGNNPSSFKGQNRPVEQVSWDDICQENGFLDKLNTIPAIAEKNRLEGKEFRLPTEAQWEYAARGGKEGVKDNFEYAGSSNLKEVAWFWKNSHRETKPVGLKLSNQLGLCDMSGNIREWCRDWWHENYENAPKNGDLPWEKDGEKDRRMIRGGSWLSIYYLCRVAYRDWNDRNFRYYTVGFRLSRY